MNDVDKQLDNALLELLRVICLIVYKVFVLLFTFAPMRMKALIDTLIYTRRGIDTMGVLDLISISATLFFLAHLMQNIAGDGVYLLASVYTFKWFAEVAWVHLRRIGGTHEFSFIQGVLITRAFGLSSEVLAILLLMGAGVLMTTTEFGRVIGPLLALSCAATLLINAIVDAQVARETRRVADDEMMARLVNEAKQDESSGFHDVRVN